MTRASSTYRAQTRAPQGSVAETIEIITEADQLAAVEHDAANYPGGKAIGLVRPRNEAEIAIILQRYARILPIGIQSSLTGGATPRGDVVLSLERQNRILESGSESVHVQTGLSLHALQEALALEDKYYPPVPSYNGATVGGVISTNAAGAATFKYGTTRPWVQALTVVLASGEVLDLERGQCHAHPDGYFELEGLTGVTRLPIPSYQMPQVAKCSAGYYAAPQMDLIDLFIGSEGTLGVITEATLRIMTPRPAICAALVPCETEAQALVLTRMLRDLSIKTRQTGDPQGLDVSAIEYIDARSLELLRTDGREKRNNVFVAPDWQTLLLVQIELSPAWVERAYDDIAQALEPAAPDVPLVRFVRTLDACGRLEETELIMPQELQRLEQVYALREAVPIGVNAHIQRRQRELHPGITKMAADMIVPFEHLETMMQIFRSGFESHGLDYATWGHISDGNMHPNLLPRTLEDIEAARSVILECGRAVMALGGSPLAEHGVGRNPIKQILLKELYGEHGIQQMRAVKQALDPQWKLSPGNLFAADLPV
jgi:D-lactate dehydrogenase (cytochrome)